VRFLGDIYSVPWANRLLHTPMSNLIQDAGLVHHGQQFRRASAMWRWQTPNIGLRSRGAVSSGPREAVRFWNATEVCGAAESRNAHVTEATTGAPPSRSLT